MRYPPEFLDRVKSALPIEEVVGKRVRLQRRGKELTGLCPFHNEKSPSFTVNNEKGFFHCFGCGAHGDAIEFIRRHERYAYAGEAIEALAREAGVPLPEYSPEAAAKQEEYNRLYGALEAATVFFEQQLQGEAGMQARAYIDKRGLTAATQKRFRLGFAPASYGPMRAHLQNLGFTDAQMLEAGLLASRDNGELYERFKARLMFPIRNVRGRVVAFGGRLLAESEFAPKYLNSPETPVFKKREVMFNLDIATPKARQNNRMVLVEGYMDVISLVQAGLDETVATLGTAVTEEHIQTLWKVVDVPIACMDGDAAGQRAMLRLSQLAFPKLRAGKNIGICVLAKGDDPDSFTQREGLPAFEAALARATPMHEALLAATTARFDIKNPSERARCEAELRQLADGIEDPQVKTHFRDFFRQALWEKTRSTKPVGSKSSAMIVASPADILVRHVLKLLLNHPELLHEAEAEAALERLRANDAVLEEEKMQLLEALHNGGELPPIVEALKTDARIVQKKQETTQEAREHLQALMQKYDMQQLEQEYEQLAETASDEASFSRLMRIQQELQRHKAAMPKAFYDG